MAMTRKFLKAMGIEEEKIEQIIEAHTETVNALKEERDKFKGDAEKLPTVQKELDDLKAKGDDGWKEKHDKVKKEYDDYKNEVTAKESKAIKEKAVRAFYEEKGITGKNLEIAMRGSRAEIDGIEMDGDKIKDTASLTALVEGDFSALVRTTTKKGVKTATPPGGKTEPSAPKSKEEILKIKDPVERQKAWAEKIMSEQKGE